MCRRPPQGVAAFASTVLVFQSNEEQPFSALNMRLIKQSNAVMTTLIGANVAHCCMCDS